MESTEDDIPDIAGEYPQDTEDILMEDLQQASSDMHSTVVEASATDRDELPDIPPVERSDPPLEDDQTNAPLMDTEFARLLNDMSQEHDSWKTKDLADLKQSFESCLELSKLKLAELKTVACFLKHGLNKIISLSGSKCDLINALKCCLKLGGQVIVKCRRKTAPTLKTLIARLLQGHKYPKAALNVSYAEWKFPDVIQKWQDMSMVRHGMSIPEVDPERQIDWFYVPEFATTRNQLEVKKIDPHHLLTRHRSAVCKGDVGNATRDHFIQVVRDNSTTLKPGMMEQQLNMQSTDFAKITFSEKVQLRLEEKGHQDSAALCQFVRDWFAVNDEPGISAVERCQMKLRYRDYLLSLVNLSSFPPPGSHIKGYPVPLWEATLASIDADFHMYAITKRRTYNNRALSSQPCESLYSCLATMPGAKNGVPSAVDLEVNMAKICGEFVVLQDPTRGFPTRLSSAPVYPQVLLEKEIGPLQKPATPPTSISEIIVQDHHFDAKGRRRLSRRDPRGISDPHEPGRGSAGVRQYHKVDESKLNPLIRAGIPVSS